VERGRRLIKHIREKRVFGHVRAFLVRQEWQKRGLPHYHILLFAERDETPEKVDEVISAEMPLEEHCSLRGSALEAAMEHFREHLIHACTFKC